MCSIIGEDSPVKFIVNESPIKLVAPPALVFFVTFALYKNSKKAIENIIKYKKELIPVIKERLLKVNYLKYEDSMQSLIFKDVEKILNLIK